MRLALHLPGAVFGGGSLVLGGGAGADEACGAKAESGGGAFAGIRSGRSCFKVWISGSSLFLKDVFAPCMGGGFELLHKWGARILAILQGSA